MRRVCLLVAIAALAGAGVAEAGRRAPRSRSRTKKKAPKPKPAPAPTPDPPTPTPEAPPADYSGIWKTTIEVVLRKDPGEHAPELAKLAIGTEVVVEKEDGRWLRVRAGGKTGYLPRTTIASTTPPPPIAPPPTVDPTTDQPVKRWSSERVEASREGTGLFVGVTAPTAVVLAEPRAGAAKVADVTRGARLSAIETRGGAWVRVRDDAGHEGWIERAAVDNSTAGVALGGPVEVDATAAETEVSATLPTRKRGALEIVTSAAIGYRSVGMDFTSNGSNGLSNYLVSADAAAADVGVDVGMKLWSRVRVGADGRLQVGTSSGSGIEYAGPTRAGGNIPFKTLAADAGVRAGTRLGKAFEVAARAGLHYDAFLTKNVSNAGRLPRERLVGVTAGARFAIAPPRSRVDVGLRLDVLALGSRAQTAGLEDGTSSRARAVWAGATIRIALAKRLSLLSAYDFGQATTKWSGMSVRFADVTSAKRVDSTQTVQVGISAQL